MPPECSIQQMEEHRLRLEIERRVKSRDCWRKTVDTGQPLKDLTVKLAADKLKQPCPKAQ